MAFATAPAPDIAIDLSAEAAALAIAAGRPLLGEGALSCETEDISAELQRLARNLADTSVEGSPAQRTGERLMREQIDVAPVLQSALDGDGEAVAGFARERQLDPQAFARMLELALQPILWEAAERCTSLTDVDKWDRGYCPICGAWPALAELVGAEKRRVLRCGRCGVSWSWLVLLCPYCGNDDHRTLGTLVSTEERPGPASPARAEPPSKDRVDVCEHCHGYVKAIATFTSVAAVRIAAEDAATVHLDIGARAAGYTRPGTVDVSTAGIPRLVREGRGAPDD